MTIDDGFLKQKGSAMTLNPARFNQMPSQLMQPWAYNNTEILGFAVVEGLFWLIGKVDEKYIRIPFAKNNEWFQALTSETHTAYIRQLPQIYIIGLG